MNVDVKETVYDYQRVDNYWLGKGGRITGWKGKCFYVKFVGEKNMGENITEKLYKMSIACILKCMVYY